MTTDERVLIMMMCGCINDIAEKAIGEYTTRQLKTVQEKLEQMVNDSTPNKTIDAYRTIKWIK